MRERAIPEGQRPTASPAPLHGLTCRMIGGYTQKAGVKPQLFELWIGPQVTSVPDQSSPGVNMTCRT